MKLPTFKKFKTEKDTNSVLKFSKAADNVTSLHGIRQIVESKHHWCKRCTWLVLFTVCGGLFTVQLALSVIYFLSWPVSVNVKINYNSSIVFPAVTICNNNAFRLTAAYDLGYYNTITEFYSRNANKTLDSDQLEAIRLDTLYHQTAHRKEDFIVSCKWGGSSCLEELEPVFTDFGLCYTFNGQRDASLRRTYTSGSGGGVSFQLNIEQYEYMTGPNEGAGVKLLVHNRGDVPLVKDNGQALRPGTLSFVAVKIIEINSLPPKYGECSDSTELEYLKHYSMQNCYIDCKQTFLVEKCGCRDIYMPAENDNIPVCSLAEIQNCLKPSIDLFQSQRKSLCQCPPPCKQMAYESIASSAGISNFDITKYLDQKEKKNKLQRRYQRAHGISTKVDSFIIAKDQHFLSVTKNALANYNACLTEVGQILSYLPKNISQHISSLRDRFEFHFHKLVDRQEFNIHNAYVRYFMETETFFYDPLLIDYRGMQSLINNTIIQAQQLSESTKQSKRKLFWPIKEMLIDKKKLAEHAIKETKKITERYEIARKLTGIPISYHWRYDKVYQEPGLTSGDAFGRNKLHTHAAVVDALDEVRDNINLFIRFGNKYANKGLPNLDTLVEANEGYVSAVAKFTSSLHTYEHDVIRAPYEFIQNEVFNSHMLNTTLDQEQTRILQKMNKNLNLFTVSVEKHWPSIIDIFLFCDMYERAEISKADLAELATSEKVLDSLQGLQSAIVDVKKHTEASKEELRSVKLLSQSIWDYILLSPFYKKVYEKLYNDTQFFLTNETYTEDLIITLAWFVNYKFDRYILVNLTEEGNITREELVAMISNADVHTLTIEGVKEKLDNQIQIFSSAIDRVLYIINKYQQLHVTLRQFIEYMEEYMDSNIVDSAFYKENFLDVDIFMQELRYEENTAQKAYGVVSLLSDIGGAMGFFIGGSVMSVAEVMDLLAHYWMKTFYLR